jgi:hypothetical protein
MRKLPLILLLVILALSSLACSLRLPFQFSEAGETRVMEINEAHSTGSPVALNLVMGGGKVSIQPGAQNLVEGTVKYNFDAWKPVIERGLATLTIRQEFDISDVPFDLDDSVNEWDLKLGTKPMELTINGRAYDADFDLSGLAITRLKINEGASSTEVHFSQPNPEVMERLSFNTGASQVKLFGLANANAKEIAFSSGAGAYTLDFSGELRQDVEVTINSAISDLKIIVPKGTLCRVDVTEGVSNVNISGTWTNQDQVYSTKGEVYSINITVQMGLGNIELIQEGE